MIVRSFYRSRAVAAIALAIVLVMGIISGAALANLDPFPSTNEANQNSDAPLRPGQDAPHVNLASAGIGEVTLEFVNEAVGLAFFEVRIDGETPDGLNPHVNPCKPSTDPLPGACNGLAYIGDNEVIYPGVAVSAPGSAVVTFEANSTVEVRLALGGERDWDFDWVTFEVLGKEDCKRGGWRDLGFRNQGLCIASVVANENSIH
jgi:hypothetical protein